MKWNKPEEVGPKQLAIAKYSQFKLVKTSLISAQTQKESKPKFSCRESVSIFVSASENGLSSQASSV